MPALDCSAKLGAQRLLAIADAEYGNAGIEHRLRRAGRIIIQHGRWPPGEDDAFRRKLFKRGGGQLERVDFAVNPRLAHPPRDQLGDLAAEIDDEDG